MRSSHICEASPAVAVRVFSAPFSSMTVYVAGTHSLPRRRMAWQNSTARSTSSSVEMATISNASVRSDKTSRWLRK
ncbi:hypothetical protein [Streptomyces sp. NPDC002851]